MGETVSNPFNSISVTNHGLRCDNPECDWVDENIEFSEYESWLDQPCPKCGKVVFTYNDLAAIVHMFETIFKFGQKTVINKKNKIETLVFTSYDGKVTTRRGNSTQVITRL
jgi:wobble nucleotide-excising tRNase